MGENWNWSLSHLTLVSNNFLNKYHDNYLNPPGIIFLILPVVVSLLQGPVEGDEAAEDEDHNDHYDDCDHGPSGLRWKHNNIWPEEQRSYL